MNDDYSFLGCRIDTLIETLQRQTIAIMENTKQLKNKPKVKDFHRGSISQYVDTEHFLDYSNLDFDDLIYDKSGKQLTFGKNDVCMLHIPDYNLGVVSQPYYPALVPVGELPYIEAQEVKSYFIDYNKQTLKKPLISMQSRFPYFGTEFTFTFNTQITTIDPTMLLCNDPTWKGGNLLDVGERNDLDEQDDLSKINGLDPFETISTMKKCVHLPISECYRRMRHVEVLHKKASGVTVLVSKHDPLFEVVRGYIQSVYKQSSWIIGILEFLDATIQKFVENVDQDNETQPETMVQILRQVSRSIDTSKQVIEKELKIVFNAINEATNSIVKYNNSIGDYSVQFKRRFGELMRLRNKRLGATHFANPNTWRHVLKKDVGERSRPRIGYEGIYGPVITVVINYITCEVNALYCIRLGLLTSPWKVIPNRQKDKEDNMLTLTRSPSELQNIIREGTNYENAVKYGHNWNVVGAWDLISQYIERGNLYLFIEPVVFSNTTKLNSQDVTAAGPFSIDDSSKRIIVNLDYFPQIVDITRITMKMTKFQIETGNNGIQFDSGVEGRNVHGAISTINGLGCVYDWHRTGGFCTTREESPASFIYGHLPEFILTNSQYNNYVVKSNDVLVHAADVERFACVEGIIEMFYRKFETLVKSMLIFQANPQKEIQETVLMLNKMWNDSL